MADRILAAAESLYLDRGPDRTTVSAVAAAAGVSRPTVYKHVGDGDAIAAALIERELGIFVGRLADALAADGAPVDRVVEALAFTVEYAGRHRLFQRLLDTAPLPVLLALTRRTDRLRAEVIPLVAGALSDAAPALAVDDAEAAADLLVRYGTSLALAPPGVAADPDALRAWLHATFRSLQSATSA